MTPILVIAGLAAGLVVLVLVIVLAFKAEKRRRLAMETVIRSTGFQVDFKPSVAAKEEAFLKSGSLKCLRTGSKGLGWIARGDVGGVPVQLLEHKYVVSTGKHTSVHYHLVASTAAPETWPKLSVTPENFLHRIAEFFGAKDLKVEDEKFNRAWRVKSDDENFALLVLHPDVQAWFLKMPGGVWIEIGNGAACVVASMRGTEETALRGARLLADFWSMLPPELHAYETGSAAAQKSNSPDKRQGW